ncbi:hypothetical protein [Kitasatospora sp. NPDC008115]|uniref:hypothetical protein n=1 Tax=Kitasatospora sp. NPDC008115 TaxID=3364022 RepID=UPI0036EC4256
MNSRTTPLALSRRGEVSLLSLLAVCVAAGAGSTDRVDVGIRLVAVALVATMVIAAAG